MQKMQKLLTKNALGFLTLTLLLSACSLPQIDRPITVSAQPIQRPQLILPSVDELRMRNVEWVIINEENIETRLQEFKTTGQPIALFVLTAEGYENLALNLSDIRALIQQQQEIIAAYEGYYVQAEETLDQVTN
jgi:hypothetical protein